MILPPMVVDVRVHENDGRRFRIWLPVILLWPLLIIIVGFAFLVSIPLDLVLYLAGSSYHHFTLLIVGALELLGASRGTEAHISSRDAIVDVAIF